MQIKTMNKISPVGLEVFPETYTVSETVENETAILVRSAKLHDYPFPDSLLAIARAGSGVENIPISRCTEQGICVFNTPGANANAVKELVICAMLIASRDIVGSNRWLYAQMASGVEVSTVVEKGKKAFVGPELYRKTLGIIGLGAIGSLVANAAFSLGMDVYGYDPYLSVDTALRLDRHIHIVKDLDELFRNADYITVHIHATPETRGLINESAIASMKNGVRFINLGKTYDGQSVPALQGIDLAIQRGEVFGIIGRSGAGKSSLIRTINRLEQPSSGRVLIDQVDIGGFDEDHLVALRRRIGMIFQHFNLMSAKTVWQNVELPLKVAGVPKEQREKKVRELLELVGLQDKHKAYPAQLSGGQKQRVGIARSLVHDPQILLCDEATSALDPETTQSILGLLREINKRLGLTIVLITHEMAVIREICDRVVVLEHGHVVEQGPVWEVFGNPQHEVSKTLLAPLQHGLPEELQSRLQANPTSKDAAVVLRLQLTGSAEDEPDLAALFSALGGRVRLLQGGVERIQGHALGQLLLAVSGSSLTAEELRSRAGRWAQQVEVLGYVV